MRQDWGVTWRSDSCPPLGDTELPIGEAFAITTERNRRDFALEFFEKLKTSTAAGSGPAPLGLHILMGDTTPRKIANMVANIASGTIAPVEIVARKAA